MLQSMEEAWTKDAERALIWSTFQPMLEKIKRISYYEPEYRRIYELLSVHLYKYAYDVEDSMSEKTCHWIEQKLKTVRLSSAEQERLSKALIHLRSTHLRSGL
jgi:hypothetical protein